LRDVQGGKAVRARHRKLVYGERHEGANDTIAGHALGGMAKEGGEWKNTIRIKNDGPVAVNVQD